MSKFIMSEDGQELINVDKVIRCSVTEHRARWLDLTQYCINIALPTLVIPGEYHVMYKIFENKEEAERGLKELANMLGAQ